MLRKIVLLGALASASAFLGQVGTTQSLARRLPAVRARPLKRHSHVNMVDDVAGPLLAAMPGMVALGAILGKGDFATAGIHLEWSTRDCGGYLCMCP